MGIRHLATLLPMVAPLARSRGHPALERTRGLRNLQEPWLTDQPELEPRQTEPLDQPEPEDVTTTSVATTDDAAEPLDTADSNDSADTPTPVSAPIYTPEQCDSWIGTLVVNDENDSEGVSGPEYHAFLSSIEDPPYIAAYFEAYEGFNQLPWVFRVVHKSLACHCQKLGLGEECCEGDNAEVPLQGLKVDDTGRNREDEDYKDLFCQQISYVFTRSIPSPAPTDGPSMRPTRRPSSGPTASPSTGPSAAPVTGSPAPAPSAAPVTVGPSPAPSAGPTDAPSVSLVPVPVLEVKMAEVEVEEDDDKPGIGLIVGIVAACLAALVAALAFVAHRRRAAERARLRKFAGDQAGEVDLEAVPTASDGSDEPGEDKERAKPEAARDYPPGREPDEDDESAVLSVWSDSEEEDTMDELHEDHEDPVATVGSALAAMGAASTVAARIGSGNSGEFA